MLITYFRSSSYNNWNLCQLDYFIKYVLGWPDHSGKAAVKGTIVHKLMEILAHIKKAKQNKKTKVTHEPFGTFVVKDWEDDDNIGELLDRIYRYFEKHENHLTWTKADKKDVDKWAWLALKFNNGQFDPRNQTIVDAEPHFDFSFKKDWAKYSYTYEIKGKELQTIEGYLSCKGTIDLVTKVGDGIYEVVDYKTGRRVDWATGEEKTYTKLQGDLQLLLYNYAVHKLYPDCKQCICTIYYIKDGGPFSIPFERSDLAKCEEMLKKQFGKIQECIRPRQTKSWKCDKFCDWSKETYEGKGINVVKDKSGNPVSMCEQTNYALQKHELPIVVKHMSRPGFDINYYQNPGEV